MIFMPRISSLTSSRTNWRGRYVRCLHDGDPELTLGEVYLVRSQHNRGNRLKLERPTGDLFGGCLLLDRQHPTHWFELVRKPNDHILARQKAWDRRHDLYQQHRAGKPIKELALELGRSHSLVHNLIDRARKEVAAGAARPERPPVQS